MCDSNAFCSSENRHFALSDIHDDSWTTREQHQMTAEDQMRSFATWCFHHFPGLAFATSSQPQSCSPCFIGCRCRNHWFPKFDKGATLRQRPKSIPPPVGCNLRSPFGFSFTLIFLWPFRFRQCPNTTDSARKNGYGAQVLKMPNSANTYWYKAKSQPPRHIGPTRGCCVSAKFFFFFGGGGGSE